MGNYATIATTGAPLGEASTTCVPGDICCMVAGESEKRPLTGTSKRDTATSPPYTLRYVCGLLLPRAGIDDPAMLDSRCNRR